MREALVPKRLPSLGGLNRRKRSNLFSRQKSRVTNDLVAASARARRGLLC
jgi:hypothetical protein